MEASSPPTSVTPTRSGHVPVPVANFWRGLISSPAAPDLATLMVSSPQDRGRDAVYRAELATVRMLFGWLFASRTLPKNQALTQMYEPAALRK